LLSVRKINSYYGELHILKDVSMEVKGKEITAVIGPNGAGKTTLLRTISGLLRPRSGTIEFLGKRIDSMPAHEIARLGISHVPEGRMLFPRMTVRENLEMGAFLIRKKEDFDETLEWVYQLFPVLRERERQRAGTLSGGEQQMLAIARGLMSKPKLLLLDEPSQGLGPKIINMIYEVIDALRNEGITILIVEQNVDRVLRIADVAYVLENGMITKEGGGKDLLNDPYVREAYLGI